MASNVYFGPGRGGPPPAPYQENNPDIWPIPTPSGTTSEVRVRVWNSGSTNASVQSLIVYSFLPYTGRPRDVMDLTAIGAASLPLTIWSATPNGPVATEVPVALVPPRNLANKGIAARIDTTEQDPAAVDLCRDPRTAVRKVFVVHS